MCVAGNSDVRILIQHIAQSYIGKGSYTPMLSIILGHGSTQTEIPGLYLDKATAGIGRISINVVGSFPLSDVDSRTKSDSHTIIEFVSAKD